VLIAIRPTMALFSLRRATCRAVNTTELTRRLTSAALTIDPRKFEMKGGRNPKTKLTNRAVASIIRLQSARDGTKNGFKAKQMKIAFQGVSGSSGNNATL
jgi:hypothetical protein